jgi:endo-1,4-beta-xylanase
MLYKRLAWILPAVLLFTAQFGSAQEDGNTMRDLAERNNIFIGAAVYTYHLDNPQHAEILSREFNMLTPEHEAKACMVEWGPGQYDFRNFDRLMAFAEERDMVVRGHALLWDECMPEWITSGQFTREEAIGHLRDYIMTVVGRYKGRIQYWDVVNEGVADPGVELRDTAWRRLIGDDYIELAFQFAHEADPDARLFYNDYSIEPMNAKSNAVYSLLRDLLERDVPIHGIGFQAHFVMFGIDTPSMAQNMRRFGELGLEVHITELDIRFDGAPNESILQRQAAEYRDVLETCLDSEYCTAFVTWGVSDRYTWLRGSNLGFYNNPEVAPLLWDDDYEPKPAYFALLDVLRSRAEADS